MDDDRWWRCWTQCDDKRLLPIVGLKDNNTFRLNFIMRLRPAWTPLSSYRVTYFPVPFSFAEQEISLWLFTIHKSCPENRLGKVNGTRRFGVVRVEHFREQRIIRKGSPVFSGLNVPNRNLCSISSKPSLINGKSWNWFVSGTKSTWVLNFVYRRKPWTDRFAHVR